MERFTFRTVGGTAVLYLGNSSEWAIISGRNNHEYKISGDAVDRLAAYEDSGLEPEDVRRLQKDWTSLIITIDEMGCMPHLRELYEAEKEGRLVVLPCKVGDTVYAGETSPVIPLSVAYVGVYLEGTDGGDWEALENIGKTVFLTREEAEAALKGGEG